MKPTRRELLATLGLAGAATTLGCTDGGFIVEAERTPDPDESWAGTGPVDDLAFPMGVQSGDPTPSAVVLWTCYDGTASVHVVVAVWDGAAWNEEPSYVVDVVDGFVHFELRDRPADQPIAFQFGDDDGRRSPVGTTRTAMDPDSMGSVRIGATSCLSQYHPDYLSLNAVVGRGPLDFWCWLGDAAYFDSQETRDEYDAMWMHNLSKPSYRAVLAAMASIYTWDDHEVSENWTHDRDFPAERVAIATDAFFANTPVRRDEAHPTRIWRSLRFGRTAEVFVLDCRGERDEPNSVYMSEEQLQWLIDGLSGSPCRWKVVLNPVPFANMPGPYDVEIGLADRWEGYPAQRQRLLEAVASLRGVLFVSGDVHHPALMRAEPEGLGSNVLDFVVGPAGSFPNPLGELLRGSPGYLWGRTLWNSARITLSAAGYAQLEIIGENDETWMNAVIDDHGNVLSLAEIDPYATE